MSIREAGLADIPRLVEMGNAFHFESIYGEYFPGASAEMLEVVSRVLSKGVVFVAETASDPRALVGMIGLWPYPHPFVGALCVEEVAWFVEPAARVGKVGILLLDAAEAWTVRQHAKLLKVAAPARSDVGRFLERRDYTAVETAFVKVFA